MNRSTNRPLALFAAASLVGAAALVALPTPQVADAKPAAAAVQAKSYGVDPVHSAVVFGAMYMGQSPFYGQFTDFKGTMSYAQGDPSSLRIDVELPMESIDTHNEQRDAHLKSPDWFNAREYPTVRFTSDAGASESGDGTMTLAGELTLHGVTKPVTATVTHLEAGQTPRGDRVGVGAELTVKRSDFGVTTMLGEDGIGDEITLYVGLQGVAQ